MKDIKSLLIMFCFGFLYLNTGCEKSADQTKTVNVAINGQLTSRDGDGTCDDCNVDDCCCGFELRFPTNDPTTFRVCGYDDGTTACNPPSPTGCGTISGAFIQQLLNSGNPKLVFCMLQGNCFQITNITPGSSGQIKISCDYDQTNPTFTFVTVPYGQTYTWCVDGNCGFEQCDP